METRNRDGNRNPNRLGAAGDNEQSADRRRPGRPQQSGWRENEVRRDREYGRRGRGGHFRGGRRNVQEQMYREAGYHEQRDQPPPAPDQNQPPPGFYAAAPQQPAPPPMYQPASNLGSGPPGQQQQQPMAPQQHPPQPQMPQFNQGNLPFNTTRGWQFVPHTGNQNSFQAQQPPPQGIPLYNSFTPLTTNMDI